MTRLARRRWRGARAICGLALSLGWASALGCQAPGEAATAELGQLGGELAGASIDRMHTGVLAVISVTPETVELCTGTLIAPNLLLTARHCVADTSLDSLECANDPAFFGEPYGTSSLWVNHADSLSGSLVSFGLLPVTGGGDEFVSVAAVRSPETDVVCGGDVALLILDEPFAADVAEPIAPRLDEPVTTGEPYAGVGFGDTRDVGAQGTRRAREGLEAACGGDDCQGRANLAPNEFQGGDGVCFGDSGGPALAADGRIIGVASRSTDCENSVYSAVSSWRDLIRSTAREALRLGDYPAPAWLVETPVDAGAAAAPRASVAGAAPSLPALDLAPAPPAPPALDPALPPAAMVVAEPLPNEPVTVVSHSSGCNLSPPSREHPATRWLLDATAFGVLAALRRRARSR